MSIVYMRMVLCRKSLMKTVMCLPPTTGYCLQVDFTDFIELFMYMYMNDITACLSEYWVKIRSCEINVYLAVLLKL